MTKSLHQQVEELESQLGATETEENENEQRNGHGRRSRNDELSETSRSKRSEPEAEIDETEDVGSERARKRGRDRKRSRRSDGSEDEVTSSDGSQEGDEAPQGDGETSRGNRRPASRDGRTSRDAARSTDASAKGNRELLTDDEAAEDEDENPVAMARLRREARENRAEALRLKQENEELRRGRAPAEEKPVVTEKKPDATVTDPEPEDKNSPQWDKWKIRDQERRLAAIEGRTQESQQQQELNHRINTAKEEFKAVQARYIEKNPDYVNAFKAGYENYTRSLRIAHPDWTNQEIVNTADYRLLLYAGQMAKKGIDPAAAIYDYCIETLGYVPGSVKSAKRAPVTEEEEFEDEAPRGAAPRKPNLRVINQNKRRSATGLSSGGQGGSARLNKQDVANMTLGELANLDTDMWAELEKLG